MSGQQPIQVSWDGESLKPTSAFWLNRARDQWGAGEVLMVEAREERSGNSHRHYHAAVAECWNNLPDDKREQYPTPEHLRKWALIRAGFHTMVDYACAGPSAAREMATFIRKIADQYAVVVAKDGVVRVYTARSQSYRSMSKEEFQASKTAVLDVLAGLIGVAPETLAKEAGAAA